jgi:oxygen-independent coproporphyrinogen-3 oxidase
MQTLTKLPRPRDVLNEFGIYVHVPFCSHRCWYCDFNAYAGLDEQITPYMDTLARDAIEAFSAPVELVDRPVVTSIFIGGGTPSLVPAESIVRVVKALRQGWTVASDAEITIECNPESITAAKLDAYLAAGINRISFGVQSLDDSLLQKLGRVHDAARALEALGLANAAGFDNVSADLIYGVPDETDDSWRRSLEGVLATGVQHVSAYALIYEEGTPLEAWKRLGKVIPVDDDDVARRWEMTNEILRAEGFVRYEISNWCKPGHASRHNSLYWKCGEYLGIGAGAHSHLDTTRSWTVKSPERYAKRVGPAGSETIDTRTRASEVMLLGLRTTDGVSKERFAALVGASIEEVFGDELARAAARDLVRVGGDRITVRRPFLLNEAVLPFV